MRRGLIARSMTELPDAVLDARLDRLRAAMAQARLDALILYTNNTRPAGVSWLTGFVPYWSEALLVVPPQGGPVLVVALTYRVKSWIERTSRVAEVIHTPRIGLESGRMIAATKSDAAVGVVDLDGLSAGIADDIMEGGPRLAVTDASALFGRLRLKADPAEIALAAKAASIAHLALAQIPRDGTNLGKAIAAVEATARGLGAEEIYVAAAPDLARDAHLRRIEGEAALGRAFALRATVAYKGSWVRAVRTVHRDDPTATRRATEQFAEAVAGLPADSGFSDAASWLVEGCRLAQPLDAIMGTRVAPPQTPMPTLVSVQARFDIDGAPVLVGAPALIGERFEAAGLLVHPIFD
jgi:Xaa-Pro aminopeptidase